MNYKRYLKDTQMVTIATCDGNQPRVRPMTLIYMDDKFFFATGSKDTKNSQLLTNPKTEFCLVVSKESGNGYIRGSGVMKIEESFSQKEAVAEHAKFVYDYWQDPQDPDFVLYELILQQIRFMSPGEMLEEVTDFEQ